MTDATILALYQVKNTWKMQYFGMFFCCILETDDGRLCKK